MRAKLFTLLFLATFFIANSQNNPIPVNDFTPSYTRLAPTDSWDGNSSAWSLFQYYSWSSQDANIEDANTVVGQGLVTKILLPPGIEKVSISHNDEYLAGSQCVRYRIIGEYDLTDNGPSLITAGNDTDWKFGCGSFGLNSGNPYIRTSDISTEKYVLIAYFNDGNDLGWPLNFQDYSVNWTKGTTPADTLLFYNWVNGISTDLNNIDNNSTEFSIYPNPATDNVQLIMNNVQLGKDIQILNITGKLVISIIANEAKQSIDISNLQNGIYFIKVGAQVQKFIKK